MGTLARLLSRLDEDNRIRGQQFERICKWYLENDPKYRLLLKTVWLWGDWPGRWGPDTGIDLVAQTHDGKLWAIQAKAYSSEYQITKRDIDSFLSESSRHIVDYRLIIATTNSIGHNARQALHGQEKPVGRVLLGDLQRSDLEWPPYPEALIPQPPSKKQAWPYQEQAVADVCVGLADRDRGQLIMACGTGKTLVAMWVAGRLECRRVLVLVPSLTLLSQTISAWTANAPWNFRYIAVCSDETVVQPDCLRISVDELGIPVTTDPHELATFLAIDEALVVFSTYQSSPQIARALKVSRFPSSFDLAIADEAHRCSGLTSGPFATILDSQAIPAKRRLFMTATPRYFTGRVREEASVTDLEVASMDDEQRFGPVFHLLSFSRAISEGLLSDYRVVIVGVDDAKYLQYARTGLFVTTDGEYVTDAKLLASHIAIVKAIREFDLRRVLTFHNRIANAERFARELPRVIAWIPQEDRPTRGIWAEHVNGGMSAGRRTRLLDRFRRNESGEHCLLANARCLGEGVDVPDIDGVAFIEPRHSQLDIIQAIGRAIRRAEHKEYGTVVLPVFVPGESDAVAGEGSPFEAVWMVLKALRAHDEALAEVLDDLRRRLGRGAGIEVTLPAKITIDMPIHVEQEFAQALRLKIVEQTTSSWEFYFGLLEAYAERNGHTLVPVNYVTRGGHRLGQWVFWQRKNHRRGGISLARRHMLENLNGWVWDASTAKWQEGFRRLCAYARQNGGAPVPPNYVTEDGYNLGAWVQYQHFAHCKGRLSPERTMLLEQIPAWVWRTLTDRKAQPPRQIQLPDIDSIVADIDSDWAYGLRHLYEYSRVNNHTLVSGSYISEDGFALGRWVQTQRADYRGGVLSSLYARKLALIPGWYWDVRDAKWEKGLSHLWKYANSQNLLPVPPQFVCADGYRLGAWVISQKCRYRKGTLPKYRQRAIEKVRGWTWDRQSPSKAQAKNRSFDITVTRWNEGLKLLRQFVQKNGHTDVPAEYETEEEFRLGAWVINQRRLYSAGLLPQERTKALERVPTWAWRKPRKQLQTAITRWNEGLKLLRQFVQKNGHAEVPRGYICDGGFQLAAWVREQRGLYSRGELSEDCTEALERIPSWVWNIPVARWKTCFQHLLQYVEQHGHPVVPRRYMDKQGFKLGLWVMSQRDRYRKGLLSKARIALLENVPAWAWSPRIESSRPKAMWARDLIHLKEYVKKEGNAYVPGGFVTEDGFKLGGWVREQRHRYHTGRLGKAQIAILEGLPGWVWDARAESRDRSNVRWVRCFIYLKEYVEGKGHACVPQMYVAEGGFKLGKWISDQRRLKKDGRLSPDRESALAQLPGWTWDASDKMGKKRKGGN